MTRKKLKPIHDVFRLESKGLSGRAIARSLPNIKATAVHRYIRGRKKKGLSWEELKGLNDYELDEIFNDKSGPKHGKAMPNFEKLASYFEDRRPKRGRRKFQKKEAFAVYKATHKEQAYGRTQFYKFWNKYERKSNPSMLLDHQPGELCVDFCGMTLRYRDENGQVKEAQIFLATLAFSCLVFARAYPSQTKESWIDGIVRAIQFIGGVPQHWKHDNAAPTKTAEFMECVRYYDAYDDPSRVRHSQDNAKAENAVGFLTNNALVPLSDRIYLSLADLNAAIQLKVNELNQISFQDYPGNRMSRFLEFEKPYLKPLTKAPFLYIEFRASQLVVSTCTIKVDRRNYSVPHDFIDKHVEPRVSHNQVEIYYKGERIATHDRSRIQGGSTIDPNHLPPDKRAYLSKSYSDYKKWAKEYGASAFAVVQAQFRNRDEDNLESLGKCKSLESLAMCNKADFEAACEYALEVGSPTVTHIRDILTEGVFKLPKVELAHQINLPLHDNVRGASYYSQGGL